jgi:hypothetical protein
MNDETKTLLFEKLWTLASEQEETMSYADETGPLLEMTARPGGAKSPLRTRRAKSLFCRLRLAPWQEHAISQRVFYWREDG